MLVKKFVQRVFGAVCAVSVKKLILYWKFWIMIPLISIDKTVNQSRAQPLETVILQQSIDWNSRWLLLLLLWCCWFSQFSQILKSVNKSNSFVCECECVFDLNKSTSASSLEVYWEYYIDREKAININLNLVKLLHIVLTITLILLLLLLLLLFYYLFYF